MRKNKMKKFVLLCALFLLIIHFVLADTESITQDIDWENPTINNVLDNPTTAKQNWEKIPEYLKEEAYIQNIQEFSQEFAAAKGITITTGDALVAYDGVVLVTIAEIAFVPEEIPLVTVLDDGTLKLTDGNSILSGDVIKDNEELYVLGEVQDKWKKILSTTDEKSYIRIKKDGTFASKGSVMLRLLESNDFLIESKEEADIQIEYGLPVITTTTGKDVIVKNQKYAQNSFVLHNGKVTLEYYDKALFGAGSSFTVEKGTEKNTFSTEKGSYLCFTECYAHAVTAEMINPSIYSVKGISTIEILPPTREYSRDLLKIFTANGDTISAKLENPTYNSIFVDTTMSSGKVVLAQSGEKIGASYYSSTTISNGEVSVRGVAGKELGGNKILSTRENTIFTVNTGDLTAGELYEITPDGKIVVYTAKSGFNLVSYHGGTPVYPEKGEEIGTVENGMEFDRAMILKQQINQAILAGDMDTLDDLCAEVGEGWNIICVHYYQDDEIFDMLKENIQRADQEYWDNMEKSPKSIRDYNYLFSHSMAMGYEDVSDHAKNYLDKNIENFGSDPYAAPYNAYFDVKDYLTPDEKREYVEEIYEKEDLEQLPVDNYYQLIDVADDVGFENADIDKMREEFCESPGERADLCE